MMREFVCQGRDPQGKRVRARRKFGSLREAKKQLAEEGFSQIKVWRPRPVLDLEFGSPGEARDKKVSTKELLMVSKKLSSMLRAGLPVIEAITLVQRQAPSPNMGLILASVAKQVGQGKPLYEAFSTFPKAFDTVFINLIRAGEESGQLDQFFEQLVSLLERQAAIASKVRSAMMYPIIMLVVTFGITTFMLVQVVPTFVDMYEGMGAELPGLTLQIIALSEFLTGGGLILMIAALATLALLHGALMRSVYAYRLFFHKVALGLPLFGQLTVKGSVSRSALLTAALLEAGIGIDRVLNLAGKTLKNQVFRDAYEATAKDILTGRALSTLLAKHSVFPQEMVQLVAVGEKTGEVEPMMRSLADYYQAELVEIVDGLIKLIEPLMIVVIGAVVGGLIMALYLPVFSLGANIG